MRSWIKVRFSIWQWVIIYLILEEIEPGPPWRNRLARCTYRHKEMRRLWVRASPGAYVFRMNHLRLCQTTCGLHLHRFWLADRAQPRTNSLKIIFIKRKSVLYILETYSLTHRFILENTDEKRKLRNGSYQWISEE